MISRIISHNMWTELINLQWLNFEHVFVACLKQKSKFSSNAPLTSIKQIDWVGVGMLGWLRCLNKQNFFIKQIIIII